LYDDPKRARQVAEEYQMLQGDIAELYRRWEALQLEETA
jgi:ATP-binding cassette subfamily F protein 3